MSRINRTQTNNDVLQHQLSLRHKSKVTKPKCFSCNHHEVILFGTDTYCKSCGVRFYKGCEPAFKSNKLSYNPIVNPAKIFERLFSPSAFAVPHNIHSQYIMMRKPLLDLIFKCSKALKFTQSTLHLSVIILDYALNSFPQALQIPYLYAEMAMLLAAKGNDKDERTPALSMLRSITGLQFANSEMTKAEFQILDLLKWKLSIPTLIEQIEFLLSQGIIFQTDKVNGRPVSNVTKAATLNKPSPLRGSYCFSPKVSKDKPALKELGNNNKQSDNNHRQTVCTKLNEELPENLGSTNLQSPQGPWGKENMLGKKRNNRFFFLNNGFNASIIQPQVSRDEETSLGKMLPSTQRPSSALKYRSEDRILPPKPRVDISCEIKLNFPSDNNLSKQEPTSSHLCLPQHELYDLISTIESQASFIADMILAEEEYLYMDKANLPAACVAFLRKLYKVSPWWPKELALLTKLSAEQLMPTLSVVHKVYERIYYTHHKTTEPSLSPPPKGSQVKYRGSNNTQALHQYPISINTSSLPFGFPNISKKAPATVNNLSTAGMGVKASARNTAQLNYSTNVVGTIQPHEPLINQGVSGVVVQNQGNLWRVINNAELGTNVFPRNPEPLHAMFTNGGPQQALIINSGGNNYYSLIR